MIRIEHLRVGEAESCLTELSTDAFFDDDGVERFAHAHETLGMAPAELVYTLLEVATPHASYTIRTQYFAHGGGWMTHRTDAGGNEEIIHVAVHGAATIIVKTSRPAGHSWMTIGASWNEHDNSVDLLSLRSHFHHDRDELYPARVTGSFATVSGAQDHRRGPWPSAKRQ